MLAQRISYILHKHGIIDSNSLKLVKKKIGFDLRTLYKKYSTDKIKVYKPDDYPRNPQGYSLDNLKSKINEYFYNQFQDLQASAYQTVRDELFGYINKVDQKVKSYWGNFNDGTQGWYQKLTVGDEDQHYKREEKEKARFLLDIIYSNGILPHINKKVQLEMLLMGASRTALLLPSRLDLELQLSTLLKMKFIVSKWTVEDFKTLNTDLNYISKLEVEYAQKAVLKIINKKIYSKIYAGPEKGRINRMAEFEFIQDIFMTYAEAEYLKLQHEKSAYGYLKGGGYGDKTILAIEIPQKIFTTLWELSHTKGEGKLSSIGLSFTNALDKGSQLHIDTVLNIGKDIVSQMRSELGIQNPLNPSQKELGSLSSDQRELFEVWSRLLSDLNFYLETRQNRGKSEYDLLWDDEDYTAWNVITQLCHLFGTDPLTFLSLDDAIFDKNQKTGLFAPHHMDVAKKWSISLGDQVLTDTDYHPTLNAMSEADAKKLKDGIRKLVEMGINGKGSGPNGEITENDVRNVFKGVTIDDVISRRMKGTHVHNVPVLSTAGVPGLWDFHMKEGKPFSEKLRIFNDKIESFKTALKTTGSKRAAFLAFLNGEYKNAVGNFWGNAETFARKIEDSSVLQRRVGGKEYILLTALIFGWQTKLFKI